MTQRNTRTNHKRTWIEILDDLIAEILRRLRPANQPSFV